MRGPFGRFSLYKFRSDGMAVDRDCSKTAATEPEAGPVRMRRRIACGPGGSGVAGRRRGHRHSERPRRGNARRGAPRRGRRAMGLRLFQSQDLQRGRVAAQGGRRQPAPLRRRRNRRPVRLADQHRHQQLPNSVRWRSSPPTCAYSRAALPFANFSTDARALGAQSFVTVNYGSGTPAMAAAWVQKSLAWPARMSPSGSIGNEGYGCWENQQLAGRLSRGLSGLRAEHEQDLPDDPTRGCRRRHGHHGELLRLQRRAFHAGHARRGPVRPARGAVGVQRRGRGRGRRRTTPNGTTPSSAALR